MAIAELPDNNYQILSAQSLSSSVAYSDAFSVERFSQLLLKIYPGTFAGTLEIYIEFAESAGGPWMPDTLEDSSAGTLDGNSFLVPVRRYVRTWDESGMPFPLPVPTAYKFCRVGVAATSGTVTIVAQLSNSRGV
jgi:hypothetical protein